MDGQGDRPRLLSKVLNRLVKLLEIASLAFLPLPQGQLSDGVAA